MKADIFKKDQIYILPGSTATEIFLRGYPTSSPLWSADVFFRRPEVLEEIASDYIKAGADMIVANTFRTQRYTLRKVGKELEAEKLNALAVGALLRAREKSSKSRPILIGGSVAPIEDCYTPESAPNDRILHQEHKRHITSLVKGGIDYLALETFNNVREARIAAQYAKESDKPFLISFVTDANGDLLSGDTIEHAIEELTPYNPSGILINCIEPHFVSYILKRMRKMTDLAIGAYANGGGQTRHKSNWDLNNTNEDIGQYKDYARQWIADGATFIGGCCGTSVAYTRSYSELKKTNEEA